MALLPLDEGEIFAERYRIVRCIASGGMGAVYEAVHTVTERRCALKVMLGHTVERERLRERFIQESKVAAQIGSDYIVDILDAGVEEKTKSPFLVMELLEGEDLAQRLLRIKHYSPQQTVHYLSDAARALDRTHAANIVHRDLKASNLFLTSREDGSPIVKVLDFGVAKIMPLEATSEGHTQTVGTPIYMAPEQFRPDGRISPATDIYALGMLAYTLLVGCHYWKDEHDSCANPFAFASIAVHGPQEPPSVRAARRNVFLPAEFDDWFSIATARSPSDRFHSASEAVFQLATVLGVSVPTSSPSLAPPPPFEEGSRPSYPAFDAMPETVESASAKLSGVVQFTPSSASASSTSLPELPPPPAATPVSEPSPEPAESDALGSERTEISLSVTNGLGIEGADPRGPRRRRRALVATFALLFLIVGGFGVRGALEKQDSVAPVATAKTKDDEPEAASKPSRQEQPKEAKEEEAARHTVVESQKEVTPIDELPPALEEAPPKRKTRRRWRPKPAKQTAPPAAEPPSAPAKEEEKAQPSTRQADPSAPREHWYRRR